MGGTLDIQGEGTIRRNAAGLLIERERFRVSSRAKRDVAGQSRQLPIDGRERHRQLILERGILSTMLRLCQLCKAAMRVRALRIEGEGLLQRSLGFGYVTRREQHQSKGHLRVRQVRIELHCLTRRIDGTR